MSLATPCDRDFNHCVSQAPLYPADGPAFPATIDAPEWAHHRPFPKVVSTNNFGRKWGGVSGVFSALTPLSFQLEKRRCRLILPSSKDSTRERHEAAFIVAGWQAEIVEAE